MSDSQTNPARLYLPLLAHCQPAVRQQACLIILATYGDRALTYLRRLVNDADLQTRQDARLALLSVAEATDRSIKLQPFRDVYIECLGHFRVCIGNYEMQPQDWTQAQGGRAGWQKVQAMLAYLVHCGRRGANRTMLGTAVWGGDFSATSLARTLTTLQQALGAHAAGSPITERALIVQGDHCLLDEQCYHTDAQLFERVYTMATETERQQGLAQAAPIYSQALKLYGGPYMASVAPTLAWCRRRREHLMNTFVLAADRVAEQAYLQQHYQQCIDVCAVALDADPTADEIVIWLMRASAAAGQRAELENAYRNYLRATSMDKRNPAEPHDLVLQIYNELAVSTQ